MKAKNKAIELIDKFNQNINIDVYIGLSHENAKQCAIITVEEILNTIYNEDFNGHLIDEIGANKYWEEVLWELKKL